MENPKVRIESDGIITQVFIDGKKVERVTMVRFLAEVAGTAECTYETLLKDESGKLVIANDKVVKETHTVKF